MKYNNINFYFLFSGFLLGVYVILMYGLHTEAEWQSLLFNKEAIQDEMPHTNNDISSPKPKVKKRIIVLSLHRSGSSLTGEMLGRHPAVYYVYEPFQLYPFGLAHKQAHINRVGEAMLRHVLHCRFTPLINNTKGFHKEAARRIKQFANRVFCQSFNAKPRTKPVTSNSSAHRAPKEFNCGNLNFTDIGDACQERPAVATKLVTVTNLSSIVSMVKEGVKVLHLVRDPRGQLESIKAIGGSLDMYSKLTITERAKKVCNILREGIKISTDLIGSSINFRDNYRRVRFEDILRQPLRYSHKIYQFVGIPEHPAVSSWLRTATTKEGEGQRPVMTSYHKVWSWRTRISFDHNYIIESVCKNVLSDLGYIETKSEQQLRDLDKSLHGIPRIETGWL